MRRYGQHYLINRHAVERIVDTLELTKEDSVFEIGPGKGVLTAYLVARAGHVTAVEIDTPLIPYLTQKFSRVSNFRLVHGDVMDFDFDSLPAPLKIIGNLPYSLTSPILRKVSEATHWAEAVFMVQKEVGDRLAAAPDTAAYGALTVGVNLTASVERIFELSEKSFDPAPRVKSSVIRLKRRKTSLFNDISAAQKVIQAAFQQRRKTILNALSHGLGLSKEDTQNILEKGGISPAVRAETISVDKFVELTRFWKELTTK